MFKIPTYSECQEICKKCDSTIFSETKTKIDGYPISIFNYRYATLNDFQINNAFELRGLTFVFNLDGTIYKTYPLLEKFFNLGENQLTSLDQISTKKIKSIYSKEDGSIISFIKLPNGKIYAKSKTSFISTQSQQAQDFFDMNKDFSNQVSDLLDQDINPIFELVGPNNRILVNYKQTDLILLKLRKSNGEYLDADIWEGSKVHKFNDLTLDQLRSLQISEEGVEGWIVEFDDFFKVKVKTNWYFSLHRIFTDFSNREDYLIESVLDEKIDEILTLLDDDSPNKSFVLEVIELTNHKLSNMISHVNHLINDFDGDLKKFSEKYLGDELFPIAVKVIRGKDLDITLKEFVKRKTFKLNKAREWIRN